MPCTSLNAEGFQRLHYWSEHDHSRSGVQLKTSHRRHLVKTTSTWLPSYENLSGLVSAYLHLGGIKI